MNQILKFLGFKQEIVKQIEEVKETKIIELKTIKDLKSKIAELVDQQRYLRNQRKTKYLIGQREIEPNLAAYRYSYNTSKLFDLYIAYGELRGKTTDQICPNTKRYIDRKGIDKIKQEYNN